MPRWLRLTLALIGASALMALPLTAQADGAAIDEARIVAVVEADGTLAITQTLVFADGAGEVVQALPATRDGDSPVRPGAESGMGSFSGRAGAVGCGAIMAAHHRKCGRKCPVPAAAGRRSVLGIRWPVPRP